MVKQITERNFIFVYSIVLVRHAWGLVHFRTLVTLRRVRVRVRLGLELRLGLVRVRIMVRVTLGLDLGLGLGYGKS